MTYVLDANVAIKWALFESDRDLVLQVRDAYRSGSIHLIAPDHFAIEVAHVLTKAQRQGIILPNEVRPLLGAIFECQPDYFTSTSLLSRAVEIATEARIGVYDCLYVALAEREDCDLVTADERLKRALPDGPIVVLSEFS